MQRIFIIICALADIYCADRWLVTSRRFSFILTYGLPLSVSFVRPDRDVAIIRKSMVTSSGIEQGQRKLLFDLKSEKRVEMYRIL